MSGVGWNMLKKYVKKAIVRYIYALSDILGGATTFKLITAVSSTTIVPTRMSIPRLTFLVKMTLMS